MDWRIAQCDFCNFSSSQKVNIDTRDCVECVKYLACKNVDSYVFLCPCPVSSLDPQYWCFCEPEDRQSLKPPKLFDISVWESQERFRTLYDYDIYMVAMHYLQTLQIQPPDIMVHHLHDIVSASWYSLVTNYEVSLCDIGQTWIWTTCCTMTRMFTAGRSSNSGSPEALLSATLMSAPVCPAACPIVHELSTRLILASWISSPCMVISPAQWCGLPCSPLGPCLPKPPWSQITISTPSPLPPLCMQPIAPLLPPSCPIDASVNVSQKLPILRKIPDSVKTPQKVATSSSQEVTTSFST